MQPLEKTLRNQLERTVKQAREIAEAAVLAALGQLGVAEAAPFEHLSEDDKALRRKLRVHGRQLGDALLPSPSGRGAGGGGVWSNDTLAVLLKSADYAGKTLETAGKAAHRLEPGSQ
jgi:hypothetical protein